MQGEIITEAEMKKAGEYAHTLETVIFALKGLNPGQGEVIQTTLQPTVDFLHALHWKGMSH